MTRGSVANPGGSGASPSAALFQQAVQRMRAGDLEGARRTGAQALAQDPKHSGALQLLAEIALTSGQTRAGIDLLERIPKSRQDTAVLANLGTAYMNLGDLPQAEKHLRRAVASSPQEARLHFNLGNVFRRQGQLANAAESYRRSLRLEPRFPEALVNLSAVLFESGKIEDAEPPLREAMTLAPEQAELNVNLGNLLKARGALADAEQCYRLALGARPGLVPAMVGLGAILDLRGDEQGALEVLQEAGRLEPASYAVHAGLAGIYAKQKLFPQAAANYRRALETRPEAGEAWCNLADVLEHLGQDAEAESCYRRFLALAPSSVNDWEERGRLLYQHGDRSGAHSAWRRVLEADPENVAAHSALLGLANYLPTLSREDLLRQHLAWGKRHADRQERVRLDLDADPERRLRVGYVSKDFRLHSVAFFIEPVLAQHDHTRFEIHCYSTVRKPDAVTRRLQARADRWHDVCDLSDTQLAQRIRDDGIDLLVDLSGHTLGGRLLVFARKPAPVQLTWIGYPNTTGMRQMDYRLTDGLADPPGEADRFHVEKLVRLPRCFSCYLPPADAPDVAPLPLSRKGHVTFGCFNNPDKLNPSVLDVWAGILMEVAGSQLLLKGYTNRVTQHLVELRQAFAERGVSSERAILWERKEETADHLGCYGEVDIALDPFPYNGVTTTCEALWMGVPVITLAGDRHAGRTGVTLLTHAGVPELVARTQDEYARLAVALAGDRERLQGYRSNLRRRMAAAPLTDAPGFTRQLEDVYRDLWRQYCEQRGAR